MFHIALNLNDPILCKKKKKIASGPLKYVIMLAGFIPKMNVKYKWPLRLAITGTLAFKSIFEQSFSQALNRIFIFSKAQSAHTA